MTLTLDRLSKVFEKKSVFRAVSAEIPPGSVVALLGSNGAGKTTLLNCLATLWAPTSGEILVDGEPLKRGRVDLRRRLMFLEDAPNLLGPDPMESVAVALSLWEADRPGIEDEVMDAFEKAGALGIVRKSSAVLSRGERYKAALIGLLAVDPELWLLDEPFASGMDPSGLSLFKESVASGAARGCTVIYSTQWVEQASALSTHVGLLSGGTWRWLDTERDLERSPERLERAMHQTEEAAG